MNAHPCTNRNAPDAACRSVPVEAHCYRCRRVTSTVYLPLSSGDVANACAVCRTCRKRRPFVTRREYDDALTPTAAQGVHHARKP